MYFLTRILEILLHHQGGIEHMCSLRVPSLPPRLGKPPQNSVHLSGKPGFEHIQGNLGQILRVSARLSAEFFFLSRQHTLVSMDFGWSSKSKPGLGCLNNGFWLGMCLIVCYLLPLLQDKVRDPLKAASVSLGLPTSLGNTRPTPSSWVALRTPKAASYDAVMESPEGKVLVLGWLMQSFGVFSAVPSLHYKTNCDHATLGSYGRGANQQTPPMMRGWQVVPKESCFWIYPTVSGHQIASLGAPPCERVLISAAKLVHGRKERRQGSPPSNSPTRNSCPRSVTSTTKWSSSILYLPTPQQKLWQT